MGHTQWTDAADDPEVTGLTAMRARPPAGVNKEPLAEVGR